MISNKQVKELVNSLIDLKAHSYGVDFNESEMRMRAHGISLSIDMINIWLLDDMNRPSNEKHDLKTELLTA